MAHGSISTVNYHKRVLYLLIGLGLLRVIGLYLLPLNLHGDEAQYWAWSRNFDWGYFSKPPMIAWLIGITTGIFGNAEWAVRLSTPLIHPVTAYIIFRTARFLYEARTGFWATCLYFLMPAVWLSSGIVSTDVALLFFWALALNAWVHLRETPHFKWAAMLGISIGFGMLSKYAMIFFIIALVLCCIFDKKSRNSLFSIYGVLASGIALIVLTPNLLWNAANDFATVGHTAANANIKGIPFHPAELLEFIVSQIGVFGPISVVLLIGACVFAIRKAKSSPDFLLAMFILSPLLIICLEALLSRANANWAVSAYVGGAILTARYGVKLWPKTNMAGVVLNTSLGLIITIAGLLPTFANNVGGANAFKRLRGWPETTKLIAAQAVNGFEGQAFTVIATDNRLVFYDLYYYGIEGKAHMPLKMWLQSAHISNHAETTAPLRASKSSEGPILIINHHEKYEEKLREDFAIIKKLDPIHIELGGGKVRRLNLWAGYGYTPTRKLDR